MQTVKGYPVPCSLSQRILLYGFFAVFCQMIFIILDIDIMLAAHSMDFVKYTYVQYLEYPIASLTALIGGALLTDYALQRC